MDDWANLPPELLVLIAQRLSAHDFVVFSAVCKLWHCASRTLPEKPPLTPWLVLAEEEKVEGDDIFYCPLCRMWRHPSHNLKDKPLIPSWFVLDEEEKEEEKVEDDDNIFYCYECSLWQPALSYSNSKKKNAPPIPPWFVPVDQENDKAAIKDNSPRIRRFFNLSTLKTHEFELPEASGRNCMGASYGCIFTLGSDLQITLLNPFTRKQITLPPMLAFSDQYNYHHEFRPQEVVDTFVEKVALSSNPWIENDHLNYSCVVAAIYGRFTVLAFARLGDDRWTDIRVPSRRYVDIVFYKDKLYAVDCHGSVVVCDLDDNINDGPTATQIAPNPIGNKDWIKKYLVESSSGDLLLVFRDYGHRESRKPCTIKFEAMKLEEECNRDHGSEGYPYKWTEVKSLGDRALFLGRNPSLSLPASKFNGSLKPNCIYFTDDDVETFQGEPCGGGRDMGIFSMETGTIEPHYPTQSCHPLSPPFWLT